MEAAGVRILRIDPTVELSLREKIVSDLDAMVKRASTEDACNHAIRLFLPALLGDDWFSSARCFVAFDASNDGAAHAFLIAYEDKRENDTRLRHAVTVIVNPLHRRRGIFWSLLRALKNVVLSQDCPQLVFEFCEQSKSGLACANAIGLKRVDECDHYLECKALKPPAASLPLVTPSCATVADLEEILKIWMGEHPNKDEAKERSVLQRDLSNGHQCWLLRIDGFAVGSVTYVVSEADIYLMNVIVVPSARCRGYGEVMVREAVRHGLANLGKARVCLETTKPNALRLYLRIGFEVVYSWTSWVELAARTLP